MHVNVCSAPKRGAQKKLERKKKKKKKKKTDIYLTGMLCWLFVSPNPLVLVRLLLLFDFSFSSHSINTACSQMEISFLFDWGYFPLFSTAVFLLLFLACLLLNCRRHHPHSPSVVAVNDVLFCSIKRVLIYDFNVHKVSEYK